MKLTVFHPYVVLFSLDAIRGEKSPAGVLRDWLAANTQGKWELIFIQKGLHYTQSEALDDVDKDFEGKVNMIFFEKQKDSVLFKMRWGGA